MPDVDTLHSDQDTPAHASVDVKPDPLLVAGAGNGFIKPPLTSPNSTFATPPPTSQPPGPLGRGLNQPPPTSHPDQQPSANSPSSFPMDIDTPSTRASVSYKDDAVSDTNMVDTPRAGAGTPNPAQGPPPSVILRIPASARQSSPASSAGKRKRRSEAAPPTPSTRPRRGVTANAARNSSPAATSTPASRDGSSVASSRNTPQPASAPTGHALSIFAEKTPNDVAAEVQTIVGPNAAGRVLREREQRNSTPSSSRGRDGLERSGVSASGRGRRVGGSARVANKGAQQQNNSNAYNNGSKGKGKAGASANSEQYVNQDFCSVCRGIGRFLCCDGCPRSFHFMCLEPPLQVDELPDQEVWYCRKCRADRAGTKAPDVIRAKDKPITAVFQNLTAKLEQDNPTQFRLPAEIRQHFVGVGTGQRGEYVDTESARNKYDRKGMQEERDALRLRDGKHRPVTCYKCGGTSLPSQTPASEPGAQWRHIVSCDVCPLHWHLDCLDPPLAAMPSASRKWMCPAHAEHVMPRRRTVRQGLETIDVEHAGEYNNGNITVVEADPPEAKAALPHEDMVINNRRYRVPEQVIQLDFWDRVHRRVGKRKREREARNAERAEHSEAVAAEHDADGTNGGGDGAAGARGAGDGERRVLEAPAMLEHKVKKAYQNVRRATRQDLDAAELLLGIKFKGPQAGDKEYIPLAPQPPPAKPGQMPVKRGPVKKAGGGGGGKGGGAEGGRGGGGGAKENGGPKIKLRVGK